ncbi:MAG: GAF domain-containing protein [Anaerolineae bacterium]|nr:GAF domain-containing protein [Anaerolineae bacterium]
MSKIFRNMSLSSKLNTTTFTTQMLLLVILVVITTIMLFSMTARIGQQRVFQEAYLLQQHFTENEQQVMVNTKRVALINDLITAVALGDVKNIKTASLIGIGTVNLDNISIVDANGERLLTNNITGGEINSDDEDDLFKLGLLGIEKTGVLIDNESGEFLLSAVVPIRESSGQIIGALLANRRVDEAFLNSLNFDRQDINIGLVHDNQLFATTYSQGVDGEPGDPEIGFIDFNDLLESPALKQALGGQTIINEDLLPGFQNNAQSLGYVPLEIGGKAEAVLIIQNRIDELRTLQRQLIITLVVTVLGLSILAWLVNTLFLRRQIIGRVEQLNTAVEAVSLGNFDTSLPPDQPDEIGQLTYNFGQMTDQLQHSLNLLNERNHAITTSTNISRSLSSILDSDILFPEVVNQIKQELNYYNVLIYMFDEQREEMVLVASTGEAGQALLDSRHKITQGKGLVGRAYDTKSTILISDVAEDEGWLPNPLLPDTKSEIAVPIVLSDQVLGVLDVQQNETGSLTEVDAQLLELVASQVAIALRNAQLFENAQTSVRREAIANSIGQKLQTAADIESVLQIAAQELGKALKTQRATVQLGTMTRDENGHH